MFLFGDTLAHEEYNVILPNLRRESRTQLRSRDFGLYLNPRSHMIRPTKSFLVIKINRLLCTFFSQ
jgi:hypothetical protein